MATAMCLAPVARRALVLLILLLPHHFASAGSGSGPTTSPSQSSSAASVTSDTAAITASTDNTTSVDTTTFNTSETTETSANSSASTADSTVDTASSTVSSVTTQISTAGNTNFSSSSASISTVSSADSSSSPQGSSPSSVSSTGGVTTNTTYDSPSVTSDTSRDTTSSGGDYTAATVSGKGSALSDAQIYIIFGVVVGVVLVAVVASVLMLRKRRTSVIQREHVKPGAEGRYSTLLDVKSDPPYDRPRKRNTHEYWDIGLAKDPAKPTTSPSASGDPSPDGDRTGTFKSNGQTEDILPNGKASKDETEPPLRVIKTEEEIRKEGEAMAAKDFNPNDKGLYFILEPEAGRQDVTETSFTTFGPQATAGQIVRHSDLYRDDRCNYYSEIKDEEVGDHADDGGEKAAGATGASPFRWRSSNKKSKRPCSVGDYDEVTFDDDDDEDDTFADLGTPAPLTVASLPNMALALGGSKVSKTSNKMDDNLVVEEDEELYENTGSLMMSQTSHDERKTDRETDAKAPTNEDNDTDGDAPLSFNAPAADFDADYYNVQMANEVVGESEGSTATSLTTNVADPAAQTVEINERQIQNNMGRGVANNTAGQGSGSGAASAVHDDHDDDLHPGYGNVATTTTKPGSKETAASDHGAHDDDDDDDDGLEMVDNVVYESSENVGKDSAKGSSQVAKHNPTHDHEEDEIEMIDNELYESSGNVITDSTADTRGSTGSVTTEGDYDEMVMTDNIVYESSETMTRDEVKGSNKPHTTSVVDEDDYDVVHIPDDVEDVSSDKRQNGKAGNEDIDSDDELVMVDNEIYESSSALDLVPQWT